MTAKSLPDQETLLKLLRYEPNTGKLYWRERPVEMFSHCGNPQGKCNNWNSRDACKEAFTANNAGYKVGTLLGINMRAHRVIWCMVHGYWPDDIDHIDHDRSNNRLMNLRNAGREQNARNIHLSHRNKSGRIGVHWHTKSAKWRSSIGSGGRKIELGEFNSLQEACIARDDAEQLLGYSPTHGKNRNPNLNSTRNTNA